MQRTLQTKSIHYDVLKFVATILVVFAHSSKMYDGNGVVTMPNMSVLLNSITILIYSFHMPLFLAISGMVYGFCVDDLGKYKDQKNFLIIKAKRLLLPYLVFGLFYLAPVMTVFGFTEESYVHFCIYEVLISYDVRHLWYLVSLFEIFCVCAIVQLLKKTKIPINSVSILIFSILMFVASYKFPGRLQLNNTAYFFVFFYLGYLFNAYYKKIVAVIKRPIVIMVAITTDAFLFDKSGGALKMVSAVLGCIVLCGITSYVKETYIRNKFITGAIKNGFGIYLFHPMIIYIMYFFLASFKIQPLLLCCFVFMVSYGCSWILTILLRKLHLQIIIGE